LASMMNYLSFSVAIFTLVIGHAVGDSAPTVQANGPDITIEAGDGGVVTLIQPGSDGVTITVGDLLQTIASLTSDMEVLKTELAELKGETTSNVTALQYDLQSEVDARDDSANSNLEMLNEKTANLGALITDNKVETEKNAAKISKSVEALDADLTKVSGAVDKYHSSDTPTLTTCKPLNSIANSNLHSSVTTAQHVVGFQVGIPCKKGYYNKGPSSITCFSNGNYCSSDKWPVDPCDDDESSDIECAQCKDSQNCDECDETGACIKCNDKKFLIYGGICEPPKKSCKELYKAGRLEAGVTKTTLITPKGENFVKAICVVEGGNAHTHVTCDALTGGRACINHGKVNAENTCTKNGYFVSPFRSQDHFKAVWNALGRDGMYKYFRTVGGVYKSTEGGGGESACAPFASSSNCLRQNWESIDGGEWWITSRGDRQEPSGDYAAYDYLDSRLTYRSVPSVDGETGFDYFNDELAYQHMSGNYYMCGSPDYN